MIYRKIPYYIYCISAQKKIESYEEKTLKELQKAADQPIHVILTHCDNMADDKLEERERCLKEKFQKHFVYIESQV